MGNNNPRTDGSSALVRVLQISAALVLLLVGCTKPEAYYEVLRENRATVREVTAILADIQDEKSMKEAKAKLDARSEEFEARARKAMALPKPPPAEVTERMQEESATRQLMLDELRNQVQRVQKLEGGKAFFKQFEGNASGLFNAVQP